jgi:1-acyl-sn-glycerol-3-phosphate acyltransferase
MLAWFLLLYALFYPYVYYLLKDKSRHERAFKFKVLWCKILSAVIFTRFKIHGREHIPRDRPYIICINHQSYVDIVYMYVAVQDWFKFIGKKELRKWPMIGIFFKMGADISVNRNNSMEARRSLDEAMEAIDNGISIGIFPEGKIPEDTPQMCRLKNGAFKMALTKQVPILPITFFDNHRRLGDPFPFTTAASPGRCEIQIHEPIITQGMDLMDIAPLRDKVYDVINGPLVKRGLSKPLNSQHED